MKKVLAIFEELVKKLNGAGIIPIIYGSLGLYLILQKDGPVNDIDFIIDKPEEFSVCKNVLLKNGFEIDPEHERELIKNGFYVSFIDRNDIEKLIKEPLKLNPATHNNKNFYNIELSQYLKIYTNGLNNKFRKERKEKDDLKKINKIELYSRQSH